MNLLAFAEEYLDPGMANLCYDAVRVCDVIGRGMRMPTLVEAPTKPTGE